MGDKGTFRNFRAWLMENALLVMLVVGAGSATLFWVGVFNSHFTLVTTLTVMGSISTVVVMLLYPENREVAKTQEKVDQAEAKAEQHPDKAAPAWEVARRNLELYFHRNRAQVSQVFLIAIAVMVVGFGFVLAAVVLSLHQQTLTPTSLVAAISGIITQFIGATFMVIYRSTMAQANQFMTVLERINTVGMAVQVLDSIPDDEKQLKNETRAQIVALLLNANVSTKQKEKKAKAAGA